MKPNEQDTKHAEGACFNPDVDQKGEHMKPNEQNTKHSDEVPYDEKTLYRMAETAATEEKVPHRWRADAVAEYVAHAYQAGLQSDRRGSVQAYQCRMGRGAITNFLRRERRQEALSPSSCIVGAKRVTLDKMITLRDGERVPMVETIVDENMPQPDARMLEAERNEAVKRAMAALPPLEREVVQRVMMEERTQVETAEALGLSRQKVQRILEKASASLRRHLAAYKDEYNRKRY
jgi:RNA polymerase sigma factor (sigma-70 family)